MTMPASSSRGYSRPAVVDSVMGDIEASPTPYHAARRAADVLEGNGFRRCDPADQLPADGAHFLSIGGLMIAWIGGPKADGFAIVGTHTDSPNLRLKPNPVRYSAEFLQLSVEVYGGVLLNSWLDRDLGIAGRVAVSTDDGFEVRLVRIDEPVLRVPQLAIHLDRSIRTDGLNLNPQNHMQPVWALAPDPGAERPGPDPWTEALADRLDVAAHRILSHDLMAFDTQGPAIIGRDGDLFASARIDNLVSTFCGTRAMSGLAGASADLRRCPVLVLYDHEEIGSVSSTGASSSMLSSVLERISAGAGQSRSQFLAAMTQSIVISADGTHATHPNYPERHDPHHLITINNGVTVKSNASVRYATDARSEAFVATVAAEDGLNLQFYSHRNDLPCGSTIGPVVSARLATNTVDIGIPQLAMHSIREMAGTGDVADLFTLLGSLWRSPVPVVA